MVLMRHNTVELKHFHYINKLKYQLYKTNMSAKRNRSSNWDEEEKELFKSVLKEYLCVIENKSLDTDTNKSKVKAWEEVHRKFNNLNSRTRDICQLKVQWKSMKVQARKPYSRFQKQLKKTSGTPPPPQPATPCEDSHQADLDKEDYVKSMISHSKNLKNVEHLKRVQMAEEEHVVKMELHRENLKKVLLEQEREKRLMEMAEEEHAIKMKIHLDSLKKNNSI